LLYVIFFYSHFQVLGLGLLLDMETSSSPDINRRFGLQFPLLRFFQAPVSTLIDYSGILRPTANNYETESLMIDQSSVDQSESGGDNNTNNDEISIRIIGDGEREHENGDTLGQIDAPVDEADAGDRASASDQSPAEVESGDRDSSYQRYDIQQVASWIEQILPFSLLLLIVFVRQHLQGFFVTIYVTAFLYKSNDILRKQTALKSERKLSVLIGYFMFFLVHVIGLYLWYWNYYLFYPLLMVPPREIPPFWHAIFTIVINDTMARQAAMAFKLLLLMYYKKGHNFRRQGQMLTVVEYTLQLYRAMLPTPVWYRFFLNKVYGSFFSSLTTGLYLTFKLTSIVGKVQSFLASVKALSRKEVHYGSYATAEQVTAAGDMCAICQEKIHTPVLLRCKHIFCEDCVSEWFERERTCPLCRALVRQADLKSYGDGSTTFFIQLF
jgi:hypothetical protein